MADRLAPFSFANRTHRTWAGTFRCKPQLYIQPRTAEEIRDAVVEAKRLNKTLMLTGSGHSPSTLTMSDEWIMNLDIFNKVLSIERHESGKFADVTVEAGIRIYQLTEILAAEGLAIQNLGSISEQSAAGIISTGTHGSSAYHGLVSEQIVKFTLLCSGKADPETIECSPGDNLDLFRAGLLSVGKLGIITHVTLRVVPAYNLKSRQQIVSFDRFVDELWPTVWTSSEFIRVWWYPYSDRCVLWRADKCKQEEPLREPINNFYGTTLGRFFYESLLWLAVKVYPSLTPSIERWVFKHQYGFEESINSEGNVAVQRSDLALNMDCLFSQFVNEWAMPLTEGPKVLRQLETIIKDAAKNNSFYVHAPFEVRISNTAVSGSTDTINPDNYSVPHLGTVPGNTVRPLLDGTPKLGAATTPITYDKLTLYLNATVYRPFGFDCPIDKWYRTFEDTVAAVGGKPHWAKNFLGTFDDKPASTLTDGEMRGLKPTMDSWFGDDLTLFKTLRETHDPQGTFLSGRHWAEINGFVSSVTDIV
ncbi:D-arabinono-1,4-lactone oxidase [Sugiyamaella lignohabitans]|uniref:D-arabinono-1,4-lactone oxidase n=1 Tax=Sugiyamaella lignohabitans TaxID=796027 RepID=A0A167EEP5_9ASCO|nr:D-arabinono-1,4-lactone oxidase [Sugiyamaella lignohabitans]ANB13982.1 D-arabinono-1,4-lactone oxidase [Sugiyamaella lignohabitans]